MMVQKSQSEPTPGLVILFGSGETSPSGRKVFEAVLKTLPPSPRLALLETPAGFEMNSTQVIGRVGEFIQRRLQNYQPQITIVQARKRGTPFSPDNEVIVSPLLEADMIFMGPGSPSYAVRQLDKSLAWDYIVARHRLGGALVLASSAVVAISAYALPVYEIFKVGEDLHWKKGLDFFGQYGLPLVLIPHWNNNDGGEDLDTSRCFMGKPRFAELMEMLSSEVMLIGIDELTALIMDLQAGTCRVIGSGGVTLIHKAHEYAANKPDLDDTNMVEVVERRFGHLHFYKNGETFPLKECCPVELLPLVEGLPPATWKQALEAQHRIHTERKKNIEQKLRAMDNEDIPTEVRKILEHREEARMRKDWCEADALRDQIAALGWKILDTPEGPRLVR
jgi:cyanophycinase-like exopeptidase